MKICFDPKGTDIIPKLFDKSHIITILIIFSIILLIVMFRKKLRNSSYEEVLRYTMGIIIILNQIFYNIWVIACGIWSVKYYLPFEVCTIAAFLSAYCLFTNSYKVFEIVYFWAMTGTVQAIITPDVGNYGYNHFNYYHFFIGHGMTVISIIYIAIVKQYKLTFQSIIKSYISINILFVIALIFDLSLNSNYLYLMHKPTTGSIMDYFGPWPWYIVVEEIVCIVMFFIVYTPYALMSKEK